MGKLIDLTGQKFGMLTVIHPVEHYTPTGMCLMTSSKDADEVERRLFNEKFNRDKGDKE